MGNSDILRILNTSLSEVLATLSFGDTLVGIFLVVITIGLAYNMIKD
jgi:hypothetical protein